MYRKFQKRPIPISTHQLEEDLDRSYASMQSQLELVDKLQRIFGENPSDPVIRFQIRKIKRGLTEDMKKLAFTGTDLHDLQEQFGAELVRGQIINARKTIESEKDNHNGILTDLINDDLYGRKYDEIQRQQDPLLKQSMREHVQQEVLENPSRRALEDHYFRKGMDRNAAFNKSLKEYINFELSDQEKSLLSTLQKSSSKLPTKTLEQIAEEKKDEEEEEKETTQIARVQLAERQDAEKFPSIEAQIKQEEDADRLQNEIQLAKEKLELLEQERKLLADELAKTKIQKFADILIKQKKKVEEETKLQQQELQEKELKFKQAIKKIRTLSPPKQKLPQLLEKQEEEKMEMVERDREKQQLKEEVKQTIQDITTQADSKALEKQFPNSSKYPHYKTVQLAILQNTGQKMNETIKDFRKKYLESPPEQRQQFVNEFVNKINQQIPQKQHKKVRKYFTDYAKDIVIADPIGEIPQ